MSHFWVAWGRSARVTFEPLLGHFWVTFCASVELGGRPLLNTRDFLRSSMIVFSLFFLARQTPKNSQCEEEKFAYQYRVPPKFTWGKSPVRMILLPFQAKKLKKMPSNQYRYEDLGHFPVLWPNPENLGERREKHSRKQGTP